MKNLDFLDSWFKKKISEPQKKDLELSINDMENGKKSLEELKAIEQTFKRRDTIEKIAMLKSLEVQKNAHPKRLPYFKKSNMLVAASFILIIGFFLKFNGNESPKLYDQFYETYPSLSINRSVFDSENKLSQAHRYYQEKDFRKAHEAFSLIQNDTAQFYNALSLMELKKYNESILIFDQIKSLPYNYPFQFYKGLNYLKLNKFEKAKTELIKVPKQQIYYSKQAKIIIDKIK